MDGPKDMRFAMTARTLARQRSIADEREKEGKVLWGMNDITAMNIKKVTRFRQGGEEELEKMVEKFEEMGVGSETPEAH